jgi:hypothetical protein
MARTKILITGLEPKYLTKNDLWDGTWLEKKYPHYFKSKEEKEKWQDQKNKRD